MRFSIITPAYNMERWIAQTIESVLAQHGDFDIEYILQDGGSTDNTVKIFESYRQKLADSRITMRSFSEKDEGMYDAINRGFARATGDIYAWINADDLYQPGAFRAISKTFEKFPEVAWLKGITDIANAEGAKTWSGLCFIYKQEWIRGGIYGQEAYFIQQDSVFWRSGLWQKVQPMPARYKRAADYWLWIQMAKYAPLWSLNFPVSFFRKRKGQLSGDIQKYKREQWDIRPKRSWSAWKARLFFSPRSRLGPRFEKMLLWLYPMLFMRRETQYYIELEEEVPSKKRARSYAG